MSLDEDEEALVKQVESKLEVSRHAVVGTHDGDAPPQRRRLTLLCDCGYGFPKEQKPRKEKILAVSRQVMNFVEGWCSRRDEEEKKRIHYKESADEFFLELQLVSCPTSTDQQALQTRMTDLWTKYQDATHNKCKNTAAQPISTLPSFLRFIPTTTVNDNDRNSQQDVWFMEQNKKKNHHDDDIVYLSPDAEHELDPSEPPPSVVVVGMLVDRRIQPGRSLKRASELGIQARRLPLLEQLIHSDDNDDLSNEPLNIDTVLEWITLWWSDYYYGNARDDSDDDDKQNCCKRAAHQALRHHMKRHPNRPIHKTSGR